MQIHHFGVFALALAASVLPVSGMVSVTTTNDPAALAAALNPQGLTITSASIANGVDGQFGIYSNFNLLPVTITNGIVLSSGDASQVGNPPDPVLDFPLPDNDMGGSGTPEFDAYGPGHIDGFDPDLGSFDVAALQVNFHLTTNTPIKFDFIFGSVEYPYWTSQFTDALLVFLDGTDATNQITFDASNNPVQVGASFGNLVETDDRNTTFAYPHGLLGRLTTTSATLAAGDHTLLFEVGDVNDGSLDSAAFIANLRAGTGSQGTVSDQPPPLLVTGAQVQSGKTSVTLTWTNNGVDAVLESAGDLNGPWSAVSSSWSTNANWIQTTVTNSVARQFFRLHHE